MAALAAGRAGARVILVEREPELGGWLLSESGATGQVEGGAGWLEQAAAELRALPEVTVLTRTTCARLLRQQLPRRCSSVWPTTCRCPPTACRGSGCGACGRGRSCSPPAPSSGRSCSAATTAPASCWRAPPALTSTATPSGRATTCVVLTNNDSAYAAALDLKRAGAAITAVVDLRPDPAGALPKAARAAGIRVMPGTAVVATEGRLRITQAHTAPVTPDGAIGLGVPVPHRCDLLLMSGGWNPTVSLFSQSRGRLRFDETVAAFVPGEGTQAQRSAGACNGAATLRDALEQGAEAGAAAAPRRRLRGRAARDPRRRGAGAGAAAARLARARAASAPGSTSRTT